MAEKQFDNDEHALITGMVIGHLTYQGVEVDPILIEGDYTADFLIYMPAMSDAMGPKAGDKPYRARVRVLWGDASP